MSSQTQTPASSGKGTTAPISSVGATQNGKQGVNPISMISGQDKLGSYSFFDPLGASAGLNTRTNALLDQGPMGTFNTNAGNVAGILSGMSGPLEGTLTGIAQRQAGSALDFAGQNFANMGALGSGAASKAFGEAIASPFAQAQAQLQSSQLGATGNALSSLLGVSGNAYGQGLQTAGGLAQNTSGQVAPSYLTNPAWAVQMQQLQNSQAGKQQASQVPLQLASLAIGAA